MAYPPFGSVQTECVRLPFMLRRRYLAGFLCQSTIGFVGLQKHIKSDMLLRNDK